mgnify:CR=1 FL=1
MISPLRIIVRVEVLLEVGKGCERKVRVQSIIKKMKISFSNSHKAKGQTMKVLTGEVFKIITRLVLQPCLIIRTRPIPECLETNL